MPSLNDIFGPLIAQEDVKIEGEYYDPAVGLRIGSTLTDWDALVARTKLGTSDFAKKYAAATPRLDALANYDVDYLDERLKGLAERKPIRDYADILGVSFDRIGGVQKGLFDQGSAADKLAAANLGLAGVDTDYNKLQRANRSAANTAPLYNMALSTAPGVLNSSIADYYQGLQSIPALMAGRYSALENTAGRELVPAAVERSNLASNLDLLNRIGTMNKDAQYFWRRPSDLETYGGIFSNLENSTKQDIGNVASVVGNMYGMGSGMGGGGFGGGGGGGIDLSKISSLFAGQRTNQDPWASNRSPWGNDPKYGMNGLPAQSGGYDYMGNWNANQVGNGGWANGVQPQQQGMNWVNMGGQQGGGGGGGGGM